MKLLPAICITAMLAPLGACQIKTGLPFATATAGPSLSAPSASAHEAELAEGGNDADATTCSQELGQDAGGRARSAHTLGRKSVNGCFVQGDRKDTYLIVVPDDQETYTYNVKVVAQRDSMEAVITTLDGERIAKEFLTTGEAWRKNLQLDGGETYVLSLKNNYDNFNTYKVRVRADKTIAEN